ncbi:unnamed protein product [Linum grandiflorum]
MNFSTRFAMKTILDQIKVGSRGPARNVVVSPALLDILLRTAACGAKGKTLEQFLKFFGAQDIHDLNANASKTMEVLRLASPENNKPVPATKSRVYDDYDEYAPPTISCANAVWTDRRLSVNCEAFFQEDGTSTVSVPYIYCKMESFRYASSEEFKVIEVPYQTGRYGISDEGPCFSMYFFLPEELSQTLGGLKSVLMRKVAIPMWKSSYRFTATETMQRMGLKMPFQMNGDFTEMLDNGNVCISNVIQSVYINVDENGTEAAAATAMVHLCECQSWVPRVLPEDEFVADHPFMYMIVERDSKAVIFTGAVFNPLDGQHSFM